MSVEKTTYAALGVATLITAIGLVPGMLGELQLIDRLWVEVFALRVVVILGIPWIVAVLMAILLTLVHIVKGPSRVRRRLAWWSLLAPGLTTLGYAVGSYASDAGSEQPGGVFFVVELICGFVVIAALVIGSILPFVWLFKRGEPATLPS